MYEQEKQAPPQFMSTHPSVGLKNCLKGLLLTYSRVTTEWKLFKDGMTVSSALPYLLLIRLNRLDKANIIYEENGCNSIKGYSKVSFLRSIY